jgi:membrane associated rhomboid family serine protease
MKTLFRNFFSGLPLGPRLLILVFLVGYPIAQLGYYTHTFDIYGWLGLAPALVWKGQVWRVITYGFLPAGLLDYVLSLFWLATLVSVVGRNWTSAGFWGYCVLGVVAAAVPILVVVPTMPCRLIGGAGLTFALLAAWDWLYRRERLLLLGIGEISARQAALLIAFINSIILFFCNGWFIMVCMWCGGIAGWLWLSLRAKLFLGKTPQQIRSERVARLEL